MNTGKGSEDDAVLAARSLLQSEDPVSDIGGLKLPRDDVFGAAGSAPEKSRIASLFAFRDFQSGDFMRALKWFSKAYETDRDLRALTNALIVARKAGNGLSTELRRQWMELGEKVGETLPDDEQKAELFEVLAHNSGEWGDLANARRYGSTALSIKDALSSDPITLTERKRPNFDFLAPQRNVISFSLFGNQPRYLKIAEENVKACPYVFPGWSCRFYVDKSVPQETLKTLAARGAHLRMMAKPHDPKTGTGLFWRFLAASDPDLDFFMVRDADSLISVKEKNAVDEWLDSDRDFHVLRDFYTHSELMLAGLWGGVAGRIGNISKEIDAYHRAPKPALLGVHNHDQLFLRKRVWPAVKSSLMQHDSVFGFGDARAFPAVGRIQPVRHVGQNMAIFMRGPGA